MSGTRRKPGRLSAHVDGYRAHLLKAGHAPLSVTRSLTSLGHLGRWMERNGLGVEQLDDRAITAFLADHIRDHGHRPTAGVLPLVTYLRGEGVVAPEPARPPTALDRMLADYREWLLRERGLARERDGRPSVARPAVLSGRVQAPVRSRG